MSTSMVHHILQCNSMTSMTVVSLAAAAATVLIAMPVGWSTSQNEVNITRSWQGTSQQQNAELSEQLGNNSNMNNTSKNPQRLRPSKVDRNVPCSTCSAAAAANANGVKKMMIHGGILETKFGVVCRAKHGNM
jgi:hypothetical protein